jgi:predicted  nucleic acid-binding Zn-ribbon protein
MEQCCCLADVHLQLLKDLQKLQTQLEQLEFQLELTERKVSEVVKEGLRKDHKITELREKHSAIKEKLSSARCDALVGILDKFIHGLDPSSCEDLVRTLDSLAESSTEHTLPAYANQLYLQAKSLMESSIQWQG